MAVLKYATPDVLLFNIGLSLDGYELIRAVRADPAPTLRGLPEIAITGLFSRAQDRVSLLRAGFQAHLSKPIEPAELAALISALAKML